MPLTQDQQALANNLSGYNYYLNPELYQGQYAPAQHYTAPRGSTNLFGQENSSTAGGVTNTALDIGSALLGMPFLNRLFGSDAESPQFQPYTTQNGLYAWADPSVANPIPYTNLPGAHVQPTAEYTQMADQLRSIIDFLPQYSAAISAQKIPDAQGQLAADTATTGPRLALQQQLQEQYGPIFDQLATESNLRKSMGSTQNDLSVLQGPGKELVAAALEAAKQYDPEYFKTRATEADSIEKLLAQTTSRLGTGLSATERDEINRGQALSDSRRGVANAPSNLDTVGNAMQFGQAGRNRELQNEDQLSKAIQQSTQFLPQSRSNVDVFQVATGKPSYNQNDTRFNTNTATGDPAGTANSLLNTGTSMWTTSQNNQLTRDLNQTNWMDTLSAITGAIGSVGGMVGGLGMCWVAREVYGEQDPRWLQFRYYLLNYAPKSFRNWYRKNGPELAKYISDKPELKDQIRSWMNKIITRYAHI